MLSVMHLTEGGERFYTRVLSVALAIGGSKHGRRRKGSGAAAAASTVWSIP
jgi:hypothetical protein